jgi:hypothetical protein
MLALPVAVAFPVERVPDGHVMGPHHLYLGVLAMLYVAALVWDNYARREPVVFGAAALAAFFAFQYVWPFYPEAGAGLSLLALLAPFARMGYWSDVSVALRVAAVLAVLVALDDVVSHALDVWTPLDWFWSVAMYPALG